MPSHHDHGHHSPVADAASRYQQAFDAAQPDPGRSVVRVELEACEFDFALSQTRTVRAWGYNGRVPGPPIEAHVGDVLEVVLRNHLPEPTNIHWHGLRISSAMDGTESVQSPVPPGGSFVYRFRLPDAGTFW